MGIRLLPGHLVKEVLLLLDASEMSSFIRCSSHERESWTSSAHFQAQWLWKTFMDQSSQQEGQAGPHEDDVIISEDPRQQLRLRLDSNGPIFRALRSRNVQLLREVLLHISLPTLSAQALVQEECQAALHMAVSCSSVACLQLLLQSLFAADPNQYVCGLTAAHTAALLNKPEHLRCLLQSPSIDARQLSQNPGLRGTVLHVAARHGRLLCISACLEAPASAKLDVNQMCQHGIGRTALHHAAACNQPDAVRLLLETPGIDVNAKVTQRNLNGQDLRTPLQLAANFGHAACVAALLAAPGVDLNHTDGDGWTALYSAANGTWAGEREPERSVGLRNYAECVRLLLAAPGANVNYRVGEKPVANAGSARDFKGFTALTVARIGAGGGNKAAGKLLLKAGARDSHFREAMQWIERVLLCAIFIMFVLLQIWLSTKTRLVTTVTVTTVTTASGDTTVTTVTTVHGG